MMSPAGGRHGRIAGRLTQQLYNYLDTNPIGEVFANDTGFVLARDPDTVRAPDIAFIHHGRLPEDIEGFVEAIPDLVVEVVSPNDRFSYVQDKAHMWLTFGVPVVWVIDPATRRTLVFTADHQVRDLGPDATLTGDPVLPGFRLELGQLW